LSERPLFVLLTAYAKRASVPELQETIAGMMAGYGGSIVAGELVTVERSVGRVLPHSISIRWRC
jgi:23S rRNA (cytosine1962-C5)-methyltransferase